LAAEGVGAVAVSRPNTESNIEVTKPQTFNGAANKVFGFLKVYKLFVIMKMREVVVEKQIQKTCLEMIDT